MPRNITGDKLCTSSFGIYLPFFSSPLLLSSSVRLDSGRSTCSGFSRNIWLDLIPGCGWTTQGHPQSCLYASLAACFGSLSCWQVNLLSSLRFWMLWTGFSLRLSIFWWIELFFYSDEFLSPCRWKTAPQHEAATSKLWYWGLSDQISLFLAVWGSFRHFFANYKWVFVFLH